MENFRPDKNKKAYSYFGTICKNYLLGQLIKEDKKMKSDIIYDDVYKTIEKMDDFIYTIDDTEKTPLDEFIEEISASIKAELSHNKLSENEIKVGNSLIDVLDNWETIFEQIESGNKYNKNLILSYIREMSDLSTKDIRVSMRRFKKIYNILKSDKINDGLI
jgi:Na+/phosphate symporter